MCRVPIKSKIDILIESIQRLCDLLESQNRMREAKLQKRKEK